MKRLTASLALLLVSLMAAAAFAQEQAPAMATAPVGEDRASALPWLKLDDLLATRERPLFAPDRRPRYIAPPPVDPIPAVEAEAEPEQQRPVPSLRGIITDGASTLVVLKDQSTAESVVVRSGDSFGPWRVIAETRHRVRLAAGSDEVVLDLLEPAQAGPDLQ